MADKLNIYLDISNLTVVGDEFRYKYSYEDILYMIQNMSVSKDVLQNKYNSIKSKLDTVEAELNTTINNISMLNIIKEGVEAQIIVENPSVEENINEEPNDPPPLEN